MLIKEIKKDKKLLKKTIDKIDKIKPGESFTVKDLYAGYEWNRLPLKRKIIVSAAFNKFSQKGGSDLVSQNGRTLTQRQLYKKV